MKEGRTKKGRGGKEERGEEKGGKKGGMESLQIYTTLWHIWLVNSIHNTHLC